MRHQWCQSVFGRAALPVRSATALFSYAVRKRFRSRKPSSHDASLHRANARLVLRKVYVYGGGQVRRSTTNVFQVGTVVDVADVPLERSDLLGLATRKETPCRFVPFLWVSASSRQWRSDVRTETRSLPAHRVPIRSPRLQPVPSRSLLRRQRREKPSC